MVIAIVALSIITIFQGYRIGNQSDTIKHNANLFNRLVRIVDQEIESLKYRVSEIEEKLSEEYEYSDDTSWKSLL